MEIHRLKPMKDGYPEELFNRLYKETTPLRKSLANQIDCRRYGVSRDIILSWFDDKFIFVFNKHFDNKDPDILKGFIINALKTFKYRILRKAYNGEGLYYSSLVELEGESELINIIPSTQEMLTEDVFLNFAKAFMEKKLSENAYLLLELQLSPPPYIIDRLKNSNSRIPNKLIAEYLGLNPDNNTERYIKNLKKEISKAIKSANEYFKENPLALS